MQNLSAIVWLYRGQQHRFLTLVRGYLGAVCTESTAIPAKLTAFEKTLADLRSRFSGLVKGVDQDSTLEADKKALMEAVAEDRKSTRLNSSHLGISYAVFCLKKKRRNRHDAAGHLALQLAGADVEAVGLDRIPADRGLAAHRGEDARPAGRCGSLRSGGAPALWACPTRRCEKTAACAPLDAPARAGTRSRLAPACRRPSR